MRLENSTYEFIKEEVTDLFVRYDVKCIPINGFELATKMGIILTAYSSLSLKKRKVAYKVSPDGFYLEPGDGQELIFYNDRVEYERLNMTILHEIGHAVLGHSEDTDPETAEAEAAFFAKYAIAPPPLVHKIHPERPEEIAAVFCISYEAALYALDYYHKWLYQYQQRGQYVIYEEQLLVLFREAA